MLGVNLFFTFCSAATQKQKNARHNLYFRYAKPEMNKYILTIGILIIVFPSFSQENGITFSVSKVEIAKDLLKQANYFYHRTNKWLSTGNISKKNNKCGNNYRDKDQIICIIEKAAYNHRYL